MEPALLPVLPDIPSTWELTGRIIIAAFLGGLVGLERELSDHPSGLRTHITVAIGAALFGLCSAYAFGEFVALRNDNNYHLDPTRVASQVVVGVGFLGGGAIIKQGNTVRGLTSAAGIWVSAAIGLAVALGLYVEAITATVTLIGALVLLKKPVRIVRKRLATLKQTLVIRVPIDRDAGPVVAALHRLRDVQVIHVDVNHRHEEGFIVVDAEVRTRGELLEDRLSELEGRDDVLSVEVG